jgi:hypothetical protein
MSLHATSSALSDGLQKAHSSAPLVFGTLVKRQVTLGFERKALLARIGTARSWRPLDEALLALLSTVFGNGGKGVSHLFIFKVLRGQISHEIQSFIIGVRSI